MKNARIFAKPLLLVALTSFYATAFAAQTSVSAPQTPSDAAVSSTQVLPNSSKTQINPSIKTLLEWAKGEDTLAEAMALATMPMPEEYEKQNQEDENCIRHHFTAFQKLTGGNIGGCLYHNAKRHKTDNNTRPYVISPLVSHLKFDSASIDAIQWNGRIINELDVYKKALSAQDPNFIQKLQNHIQDIKTSNASIEILQRYLFEQVFGSYNNKTLKNPNHKEKPELLMSALAGPEHYNFLNHADTAPAIRRILGLAEDEPVTLENLAKHADKIIAAANKDSKLLKRLNFAREALEEDPLFQDLYAKLPKDPIDAKTAEQETQTDTPEPKEAPTIPPAGKSSKLLWALVITGTIAASVAAVVIAEKLLFKYRPGWWKKIKNKLLGTKQIWIE